ncbi:carbohydrate kinase family protein [Candidatus Pacearchaeota archaeon]|nr:carbohydrate kinase family protein [Candidatus Pacearchaeota archaeon]
MYDIITIGSARVDVIVKTKGPIKKIENKKHHDIAHHLGEKLLIEDLLFTTSGGGTNSAIAFSRLGLKTAFVGCIANDMNGEFVAKELKKENVEFLGKVKQGQTGYSVIIPGRNESTILRYKGVNNSLLFQDIHFPLETKWLYISSLPEESFEAIEKIALEGKKQGIKIALNIGEYLAKQGLNKLKRILKIVDIFILNKEEAAILTDKARLKQMLETLAEHTNAVIVITNEEDAISALSGKIIYTKHIAKINPIDKTGAGDAFASGFVYGMMAGKGVETSLNFGHKQALSVISSLGAKSNLLRELK